MGEIQRYRADLKTSENAVKRPKFKPDPEGSWVRFTDHVEAVRAAVTERDREWEARIETEAAEREGRAEVMFVTRPHAHDTCDRLRREARLLRSLLSVDPNTEKEARS